MFDLTNRGSFNRVRKWVEEFNYYARGLRPIIIVGNKSDLFNMRVLTNKEILDEVEGKLDLTYFEISVKDNANVDELMDYIITTFKRLIDVGSIIPSSSNGVKAEVPMNSFILHRDHQGDGSKKQKKCCNIM